MSSVLRNFKWVKISCYNENNVKNMKCLELHECMKAWIGMIKSRKHRHVHGTKR